MTHLNEHFFVEHQNPNETSFRRYCCHLQFEHYRMILNNAEMFVEANKSVLRQAMELESSAYADQIIQRSYGPVHAYVSTTTGLLSSDPEQENTEIAQIMHQLESLGEVMQLNLPRRAVSHNGPFSVTFEPIPWEEAQAQQLDEFESSLLV